MMLRGKVLGTVAGLAVTMAGLGAYGQAVQSKIEIGAYQIDPMHSKVGFEIPHLVISTVEGRFTKFAGGLSLAEPFNKSTAKVDVELASIDTGEPKRDDHLRSPDFFDVKQHPKMSFQSTSVSGAPDAFKLTGDLTIKGITKKVTFDGKYLGTVTDGYGNRKAAFSAKAKVNRKDFSLTWNNVVEAGPVVGDEVTIDLRLQAAKEAAKDAVKEAVKPAQKAAKKK